MSDNAPLGKKPWLLPVIALAWPVLVWAGDRVFIVGQRDAEMINLQSEIVGLQVSIGDHHKLDVSAWASQRMLDDKQQDLIEANRAERDSQLRTLVEKIVYNTARIDRDEIILNQIQDRIQNIEKHGSERNPR